MNVRFKYDKEKSKRLRKERGIGFEEVQDVFFRSYHMDSRNDDPEQFRAIGWHKERLYSVIYEIRAPQWGVLPSGYPMEVHEGGKNTL